MKIILNIVFIFQLGFALGQNIIADLEKVNKVLNQPNIYLEQEIKYYINSKAITPYQTEKVIIKKSGQKVYLNSFNIETVINDKYELHIDHINKTITVTTVEDLSAINDIVKIQVDSLIDISSERKYNVVNDKLASWEFLFKQNSYKSLSINYNKKSFLIDKIVMYSSVTRVYDETKLPEKPRIEIVYKNFNSTIKYENNIFSEKKFVKDINGKFTPQLSYKGYKIIYI